MSAATPHGAQPYYFVPEPSRFPVLAATALLLIIFGAGQWINSHGWGAYVLLAGFALLAFVLQQWFRAAIGESEGGLYSDRSDVSFRWRMSWFSFSEVLFFGAFFGALFWTRVHALPTLGSLEHAVLWPDFKAVWPSSGVGITGSPAGIVEPFATRVGGADRRTGSVFEAALATSGLDASKTCGTSPGPGRLCARTRSRTRGFPFATVSASHVDAERPGRGREPTRRPSSSSDRDSVAVRT